GGKVTISWPDVSKLTGAGSLVVTADANFANVMLPFSFDPDHPTAVVGQVLSAARSALGQGRGLLTSNPQLSGKLPLIGKSAADLDPVLAKLSTSFDNLIAANNALTLDQMQTAINKAIADALGLPAGPPPSLIQLAYQPAVPANGTTPAQPAALVVHLTVGACSADRPGAGCTVTTPALTLP